jgi:Tol biopolymer transport system component
VWSRDSRRIFFSSNRSGTFDVLSQPADGASGPRVEFAAPGTQLAASLTPDGTQLLVYEDFKDLSILNLANPGRLVPLMHSDADERLSSVSPDLHWIAYESDEAGKEFEIFVRPFPNVGDRREKISINGGRYPVWGRPDSHELYYVTPNGEMMAASLQLSPTLTLGPVTKLFDFQKPTANRSGIPYDVAPDGRFLAAVTMSAGSEAPTQVSIVLNWFNELSKQTARR